VQTHLPQPTREFDAGEFALVVALAFGLSVAGSLAQAFDYQEQPITFGDVELLATVAYEVVTGAVIFSVLRSRGWRLADFAIYPSRGSTILGVIAAFAMLGIWFAIELVVGKVPAELTASLASVAVVSVVNPVFEEVLVLGYVVQAMRKRFGLATAVNVSLTIRLLYHLYQGPKAIIPIAVFGLAATFSYVRLGRLWPTVVMHGILDFVALAGWVE
jgi:membrane protease YdiL (CAAX protease family)